MRPPLHAWRGTGYRPASMYLEADGSFTLHWWPRGWLNPNARERRNCTLPQALRFARRHHILASPPEATP